MDILHILNVIIGFSMVMLILSITTSLTAQTWLTLFKTKARAVGKSLTSILEDIGLDKEFAKETVDSLLNKNSFIFGEKLPNILGRLSAFLLARSPKNISREEFVILLLRKAKTDNNLAQKLKFSDTKTASAKLNELEQEILRQETQAPTLPSQVWKTNAMQLIIPELSSAIFARFDESIDRANEDVSVFSKLLIAIITLPLLLTLWPVNSIDLLNKLYNDRILSANLEKIAEQNIQHINKPYEDFKACLENNKNKPNNEITKECDTYSQKLTQLTNELSTNTNISGLIDGESKKKIDCEIKVFANCKRAEMTPGIFITWVLVSLGSAFWIGVLNKILGIRSELNTKIDTQREFRATSQQ